MLCQNTQNTPRRCELSFEQKIFALKYFFRTTKNLKNCVFIKTHPFPPPQSCPAYQGAESR